MPAFRRALAGCVVAAVLTGCETSEVATYQVVESPKSPPPTRVLVHDFAASVAGIPVDAPVGARVSTGASLTPEQIATDRQLGEEMASQLVTAIRAMGLPAERAKSNATPQVNDVVIQSYLVSIHESNLPRRFTIGFDAAATEITAVVESFQITTQGLGRRLDFRPAATAAGPSAATIDGTREPTGFIVATGVKPAGDAGYRAKIDGWSKDSIKEISGRLRTAFQEQGWIH